MKEINKDPVAQIIPKWAVRCFIICFALLAACNTSPSEIESKKRPINPWAIRSVLDMKPRMITVALDTACYVAYDLEHCAIYKAWKGGVNWDGTVYNEIKVAQPTTWGKDYLLNQFPQGSWAIERNGLKEPTDVKFLGYRFEHNQIYFKYLLTTADDSVEVEELPEFVRDDQENPGLERTFWADGGGQNTTVVLTTNTDKLKLKSNAETVSTNYYEKIPHQAKPETSPDDVGDLGKYWIDRSDCFTCHTWDTKNIGPAFEQIAEKYANQDGAMEHLIHKVKEGGSGVWGEAVMNPHPDLGEKDLKSMVKYILSLSDAPAPKAKVKPKKKTKKPIVPSKPKKPGFGTALVGVHPSYNVQTLHLPGKEYKVGGLAFLPDGRLVVTTWSPQGYVYILEGVETGDSSQVKSKIIAQGLYEPLGVEVVDGKIYVMQKHELTQLIDHDGDEVIDEYRSVCNGFGVTSDFHEFAYGLEYKDGYFYASLGMPMRLMANEKPLPDRGKVIKIAEDGSFEWINYGLRQPNGIRFGIDGELFVTDNQGQWLPANKFIHVRKGDFNGMRWGLPDSLADIKMVPPAVWLPEDEIANSPSEPTLMHDGPYQGQMMYGDVSHGGIKRVFLEKINGAYQGVVFRFTQGLEVGINRIRRGPDGALYIGGVGMGGGWSWKGTNHGLQRMEYNGKTTFEMLTIRAKPDGFELEFTEPLAAGLGNSPGDYTIHQWWYLPTEAYGGPKKGLKSMKVIEVKVSTDRKKVQLSIPGLKKEHLVKFDLSETLQSESGQELWSSEAWYTLNDIPQKIN